MKCCYLILLSLFLSACVCKVNPPILKDDSDRKIGVEIAGKINKLDIKAFKAQYESEMKKTYSELNDCNACIYIWLQSAQCLAEQNHKELAKQVLDNARESYRICKENEPATINAFSSELTPEDYSQVRYVVKQEIKTLEALQ